MNFGKRRIVAALGLVLTAVAAGFAWALWGTDGLVAVVSAAVLIALLALGWLLSRTERNLSNLIVDTRTALESAILATTETGDQAEQLLRAVHSGFARSEHTLDTLETEWRDTQKRIEAALDELTSLKHQMERDS